MFDNFKVNRYLKKIAKEYTEAFVDLLGQDQSVKFETEEKIHINKSKFIYKKITAEILIMVIAVTLISCWKPIYKFAVDIYDKFAEIIYKTTDDEIISLSEIKFNYVPDGYEIVNIIINDNIKFYDLLKNNNNLSVCFQLIVKGAEKGVDIEDAEFVKHPESFVVEKEDVIILIVQIKNISVEIIGNINKSEAIKIVNSITW